MLLGKRSAETNEDASANAELDLLFMEDEPDRLANSKQHFDMDDIVKSEQKKMDKKKKSSKKTTTGVADDEVADDFEIDVKDERFKALLDAPQFAIDPTSSKFKKTPAMVKLMEERKRRQKGDAVATETSGTNSRIADVDAKNGAAADSGSNLSALVDKLKRRQQELTARSKPMKKLKFSAVGK